MIKTRVNKGKFDRIRYRRTMEYKETERKRELRKMYQCKSCRYESDRQYNVLRHEERIHSRKFKRTCCEKIFTSKGEWYFHCEECHPNLRSTSFISKKKYKIVARLKNSSKLMIENGGTIATRRSTRIHQIIEKQRSMLVENVETKFIDKMQMEDVPLIYFIRDRKLREKFMEQSCDLNKNEVSSTISCKSSFNNHSDDEIKNVSSTSHLQNGNYANNLLLYDHEIITMRTETIEFMSSNNNLNYSNGNNDNNSKNNFVDGHSMTNLKCPLSADSSNVSTTTATPFCLPLKKKVLWEMRNNSANINYRSRLTDKSLKKNRIVNWCDKENINPIIKNQFDSNNNSEKVHVTRAEESFTWNQITQHHRAYLSSIDFERFKLF